MKRKDLLAKENKNIRWTNKSRESLKHLIVLSKPCLLLYVDLIMPIFKYMKISDKSKMQNYN